MDGAAQVTGLDPAASFEEDPPRLKDDGADDAPGEGHNSQSKRDAAWARILPAARSLDEKIDALMKLHITPLREDRNELWSELANDFNVPTKVRNARYANYRIEMDAIDKGDDLTLASLHEAYKATPVGGTVNMLDVIKRADTKRDELEKARAAKAAKAGQSVNKSSTEVKSQEQAL